MPTTGVYSGNDLAWENIDSNFIDLDYESAVAELRENGADQDEIADAMDCYEGGNTLLYGDWIDENGLYAPDPNGEYAFIYNVNENTAQVVFSKTVKYGRPASPCYPDQADAEVNDPSTPDAVCWLAYHALPSDALRGAE